MSSRSSPIPTEPGSSSISTLQSPPTGNHVRIQTPEAPASLDDLLKSPHNPAFVARNQPSSTLKGASPDDQRRRNGFHLWRTESEDAKKARLHRAMHAAEAQAHAPPTMTERLRNKLRRPLDWLDTQRLFSLYRRDLSGLPQDVDDASSHLRYNADIPETGAGPSSAIASALREPKLTRFGLIVLTISLAGAQLAWTLELAYGTPYLLSLGLSEQSTSLVWLAGPLSGLIAQPVVGSLSDHSTSSFRRRKYMIISATLLTLSTLTLAYSVPISTALVDLFGGGLADWDPRRHELVHSTTQAISVLAFWILDFALNGLQAASRALILDTAPSEQQSVANAWQGRMTHAGNVVGYLCGWVDLASWKGLRWLGGGQFRRFAMISLLAMISCVSVTIASIAETPADSRFAQHNAQRQNMCTSTWTKTKETIDDVWHAIRRLPRSVRRVCLVQLFAFMGWFPFLFYGTTYVLQIAEYERKMKRQQKYNGSGLPAFYSDPEDGGEGSGHSSSDRDAERGSFAMLLFAVVSLTSAAIFPYLSLAGEKRKDGRSNTHDQHQDGQGGDEDDAPTPPLQLDIPHTSDQESLLHHHSQDPEQNEHLSRRKRVVRGLTQGVTLRTFWTLASITFAGLMLIGTAWASTVHQATIVIALVGIPWSIAAWAPFAMVGEFVREAEDGASPFEFEEDHWSPERTRLRAEMEWMKKQRRERRSSVRQSISRVDDGGDGEERGSSVGGRMMSPDRASLTRNGAGGVGGGFRYIDDLESSPHRRGSRSNAGGGEQGARARIRASLVDCAPLPHTLADADQPSGLANGESHYAASYYDDDDPEGHYGKHAGQNSNTNGGAGTILGIHNLAIVAPQFVVAIIASLIFSAVNNSSRGIHLVLGQPLTTLSLSDVAPLAFNLANSIQEGGGHRDDDIGPGGGGGGGGVGNPAEGTVWVLRFGGMMALFAALATRFVPLTLSERRRRFGVAVEQGRRADGAGEGDEEALVD